MSAATEKLKQMELQTALAFAKLELLELEAGKRTFTQCPGLTKIGQYIAEAKANGP